jgi:hypothetical protein
MERFNSPRSRFAEQVDRVSVREREFDQDKTRSRKGAKRRTAEALRKRIQVNPKREERRKKRAVSG